MHLVSNLKAYYDMIAIEQIKAARAILGMGQKELAAKAGVSIATLNNLERGAQTDPKMSTMKAIQQSLEAEGIEFIADPLRGVGLYLKPRRQMGDNIVVLIIDDSKADRTLYKNWLKNAPNKKYTVFEAENASAGLDAFAECNPDCIILDFMMYGADGFQLLASLKKENIKLPPIIFITGMHNEDLEESAKSQGVYKYLNKQELTREILYETVKTSVEA